MSCATTLEAKKTAKCAVDSREGVATRRNTEQDKVER